MGSKYFEVKVFFPTWAVHAVVEAVKVVGSMTLLKPFPCWCGNVSDQCSGQADGGGSTLGLGLKGPGIFKYFCRRWIEVWCGGLKGIEVTGPATVLPPVIHTCISFHSRQILSPSKTGFTVSARRSINIITLLTLVQATL